MIPFRHTDERVFAAVWKIDDLRHQTSVYEVVVDPATFADLYKNPPAGLTFGAPAPAPGMRMFGMPVVRDHTLKRGEIVVRHEVEA